MELIYIEPSGVWKGLSTELTKDPVSDIEMLKPHTYGGVRKDSGDGPYYVMREEAYNKAQRECFKFFYRNTSRSLYSGYKNEIIKDRTIACNLILMKFDMKSPETGSMVLRDASPYMAKLMYDTNSNITPDEYERSIIDYAHNFARQIDKLKSVGSLFILETEEKSIEDILIGIFPFILPKIEAIRNHDKHIVVRLLEQGKQYDEICEKISEYSLLPVCLASETGFDNYVKKIVAEATFEYKYPSRIESLWAKNINEHIRAAWLTNPCIEDAVPIPCHIVGKTGFDKVQVLANDADAELEMPYSKDNIYVVDPSWLIILTRNDEDMKHLMDEGLGSCSWV